MNDVVNIFVMLFMPRHNQLISRVYIGEGGMIMPATMTLDSITLALALATLG
jgi:hypothetical protein